MCVSVYLCMCVCVFVCVREREKMIEGRHKENGASVIYNPIYGSHRPTCYSV